MRNWSLVLHVSAGVMLLLAIFVLASEMYGVGVPPPPCDGTKPGPYKFCATGTVCPGDLTQDECPPASGPNHNLTCQVAYGQYNQGCTSGGNINTQLCKSTSALCTKTFWCAWNDYLGSCNCTSNPYDDLDGNQVYSTASQGTFASCSAPPS